jgi:ribonuclease HI
MNSVKDQFLLFSHVERRKNQGEWNFVLQKPDGAEILAAKDAEPEAAGERLELLAVLRGLEALDQPADVTVFTPSRYVLQGVEFGLDEWRRNGWNWERYGQMAPVKNRDLWQRIERARRVHQVTFRRWRLEDLGDEPRVILSRRPVDERGAPAAHFRPLPLWRKPARNTNSSRRGDWREQLRAHWAAFIAWLRAFPLLPHLQTH